jgi:hypothetical protein
MELDNFDSCTVENLVVFDYGASLDFKFAPQIASEESTGRNSSEAQYSDGT